MKIVNITREIFVKKSLDEYQKEVEQYKLKNHIGFVDEYKKLPLKAPRYLVEMSMRELQLVSYYLELEKRGHHEGIYSSFDLSNIGIAEFDSTKLKALDIIIKHELNISELSEYDDYEAYYEEYGSPLEDIPIKKALTQDEFDTVKKVMERK